MSCIYVYQNQPKENLEVIFFDVGQGDSYFIETPEKYQILVDGGDNNLVVYKLGQYLPFYDREIDLIIVSHPHDFQATCTTHRSPELACLERSRETEGRS